MKIAILTTDNRELSKDYENKAPQFGIAPEALLQGLAAMPELAVHVVSCTRKPMRSPERLAENIWFHSVHAPKIGWIRTAYQGCIRATRKKLREIQPEIVHGQGTELDCALEAVFSGFPNVLTIHGNMAELARLFKARPGSFFWLAARLENFALQRTSGVFCNSEYTENLVAPRAPRTWRVPNAIRAPFFEAARIASPPEKCVLLNVGLVSKRKRQVELLELARRLHEQGLNFEFRFVGHAAPDNAYAAGFLGRVKEAESAGYGRYLGLKSGMELIECFDASHGLIHFPSEEAFGLVVAEGLARDLKFFGTGLGGMIDISGGVPDAELFGLEDWDGLAAGIAKWIRNGHARSSGAAKLMRARYHPSVIAQRHVEIYREVLGRKSDS